MIRTIDLPTLAGTWPSSVHRLQDARGRVPSATRPGALTRLMRAIFSADARFRDTCRITAMCDRMRRDVGLPERGPEALRMERLMLQLQTMR